MLWGILDGNLPDLTVPISLFTGASIGVSNSNGFSSGVGFASVNMLEYQVYDFVPTDSQRRAVETGLMERYQF
ncbi:MAG: hypothetical protein QNL91_03475 [Candidatus Krumholzibacteria bacterium]|nr:hypothetical protein [Candidatus Krumholzibacteria bacterium]